MFEIGTCVEFDVIGINGEILETPNGYIKKIFKNGKAQVRCINCPTHFYGRKITLREKTFNVQIDKLRLLTAE